MALVLVSGGLILWIRCGPLPEGFLDPSAHQSVLITDRHGDLIYESLSPRGGRNRWVTAEALPPRLVEATLAAEDRRFFSHPGLDPIALVRAAIRNVAAGRIVEGGSTITQQAVKQISISRRSGARGLGGPQGPPPSFAASAGSRRSGISRLPGKLREMLYALRLELRLDKREILALYLNLAPYGNQHAGAVSASFGYFGAPPEQLTAAQAAFLAALPRAPGRLDPYRNGPGALARQRAVLARMETLGFLSASDARNARREVLRLVRDNRPDTALHFTQRILERYSGSRPRRIETTLDLPLQRAIAGILATHREALDRHGAHNAAIAVLDNASGEWLAWEGSGDYFDAAHGGTIDGVIAPRQPGSALKPFTYALAFEKGFTPASVLPDVPSHFPTAEPGALYSPRNYDGVFRGPLRARAALAGSENVPAVWLLSRVGVSDLLRLLRRLGFTTLEKTSEHYGFGLTMGDAEVRLAEVVAAYAVFARGGVFDRPRMIRATWGADARKRPLPRSAPPERVISPRAAYWVTDILSDAKARAYAFGVGSSLDFSYPVAVKTGTSQAYRDNWAVGYTRDVTVGVWVGNFDRSELENSSGVTGAAPIFHAVLEAAQRRVAGRLPSDLDPALVQPPADLQPRSLCALSGLEATTSCPTLQTEWLPHTDTVRVCSWHFSGGGVVSVAWPAEYQGWARRNGLVRSRQAALPIDAAPRRKPLAITNPPPGAIYLRDPTLRAAYQTLPLRAVVEGEVRRLQWQVNGRSVGVMGSDQALAWPVSAGRHVIRVRDDRGQEDETTILVK